MNDPIPLAELREFWARYRSRLARPYPLKRAPSARAFGSGDCWCGQACGHDWPGKADGAPHPRD